MQPAGAGDSSSGYGPSKDGDSSFLPRASPYDTTPAQLNDDGLPIRPGKDKCLLYLSTGACKSGTQCIFDHPARGAGSGGVPAVGPGAAPAPGPGPEQEARSGGLPAAPARDDPAPAGEAPREGLPPVSAGGTFERGVESKEEERAPQFNEEGLPVRPGTQKCSIYLRSGVCNFGAACRFDHPTGLGGILAGPGGLGCFPLTVGGATLNEAGMARRPGKEQCPYLERTGNCPFAAECRFDHSGGGGGGAAAAAARTVMAQLPKKKDSGLGGTRGKRPPAPTAFRRP